MLAEDFRACLLCAALSQLYKKCGLSPATKNSSTVPVFETEFGTNILGVDFNLVFNSNNSRNGNNEFVVCDICFENPSEELVDQFSQKVETISTLTDEKIIGFVVFLSDVPTSIINFAKNLGGYALCYHDNPVIQPILRIIDEFCNELVIYDLFLDSIIRLRHEIAGFFVVGPILLHQQAMGVIDHNRYEHNDDVHRFAPTVEKQTDQKKHQISPLQRHQKICRQCQRQVGK